jgi:hypothetical protein
LFFLAEEIQMSSFNMPPGVNEGMIPGNTPEDLELEALYERLAFLPELDDHQWDQLIAVIGEEYARGYDRGLSDGSLAGEYGQ